MNKRVYQYGEPKQYAIVTVFSRVTLLEYWENYFIPYILLETRPDGPVIQFGIQLHH